MLLGPKDQMYGFTFLLPTIEIFTEVVNRPSLYKYTVTDVLILARRNLKINFLSSSVHL